MKSQRQLQIGESLKRQMSDIFLREDILSFPGSYITILEADVSPDAKNVKFFIDIFGNDKVHDKIVEKLNDNVAHLRFLLAKKVTLRAMPEITFVLDKTQSRAMNLENLFAQEGSKYQDPKPKSRSKKK